MPSNSRRSAAFGIVLAVIASLIVAFVAFEAVRAFHRPAAVAVPPSRVIGH